jgi:hypothetical protein
MDRMNAYASPIRVHPCSSVVYTQAILASPICGIGAIGGGRETRTRISNAGKTVNMKSWKMAYICP